MAATLNDQNIMGDGDGVRALAFTYAYRAHDDAALASTM